VKARKTSKRKPKPAAKLAALGKRLRQTERRLREVERRYEIVLGTINEGAYDWNIATDRIVFFESVHRALGLPSGTLKTFEDWRARIHPDDFPRFRETTIAHLKGETERFECDYRYRAEDGSWRWARTHGLASRDKRGRAVRMIGATGDITELKERERELAEQRAILETTLENMDQGITMVDGNLRNTALNRRFHELLDFPPERFRRGEFTLEDAFRFNAERGEYGPGDVEEQVRQRIELARRFEPHDFERRRPDGTVIAVRGRPLPGRAGFVTTYTDVTEQRKQEEALRQQNALTRAIVDQNPNSIFCKDQAGRFTLVNRKWTEMSGVPAERAIGHTVHDIYPKETAERFTAEDAKLLAQGTAAAPIEAVHQGPRDPSQWRIVRKSVLSGEDGSVRGLICTSTDISELKRAESEIAHQAKFTNEVFDSLPIALSMRDRDGKYLFVNRTWEKCFGDVREDVVGKTVHDRLTKEEAEEVLARDREALERGPGAALDMSEFSRRGRHYLQTRTVMVDSQGATRGVLIASLDVTEKHRAEEALAQERERLRDQIELTRAVMDESPSPMYLKDWQGRYQVVNDAWLKMVGVTRERAIGRNVMELFPEKESEKYFAEDMRLVAEGGASEVESMRTGPDGKPQWVIVRKAAMRNAEGDVVALIGANTDITRLKQYEVELADRAQRLALVVSATQAGIVDFDVATETPWFSERFKEMLGYPADFDTSGWSSIFGGLMHPDDRDRSRDVFLAGLMGTGIPNDVTLQEPLELRLRRADGSWLWVQSLGLTLRDDAGEAKRYLAAVTDITERRAQEEALRESVRLREEVERMSRHDLKTPLTSVIAMARLLREGGRVVPEDAELLATIERAGYRILNMVNLSLDMFRMETGTYQFHPQAVDLAEVARRVAADLEAQAASKNIDVRVRANGVSAATQEVLARGDELLSYSMFANLVKNAIEASPPDCVVGISVTRENGSVVAEVHNPGEVPEAMRKRFFQKYATTGKSAGLGLGTYSARLMARVQEGDLSLETSDGNGTTLVARMKVAGPELPRAVENRAAASKRAAARESLPAQKVLVVDDDEFNRLVLRRYLPSPPLEVAFAVNGRAALEAAEREWPDVVLLDLEMPVMDGYQTALKLREIEREQGRKRSLIVAISSNDEERIVAKARAAGCDEYVVKPAPRDVLWRVLGASANEKTGESGATVASAAEKITVDEDLKATMPEFLRSRLELLDEMPAALAGGDRAQFKRCAHRLAGSFALYGFAWAAAQCRALELGAENGEQRALEARVAAVRAHLDNVTIEYERGNP
jgi:PAS domain S-box-containing protein